MPRKGRTASPETRELIAAANRGKRHSEATKEKMRASQSARGPKSEETKAKMRAAALGKPKSEATRLAMSIAKLGRPGRKWTDAQREAMSARRLGTRWSEAQRAKLTGASSPHFGKPPRHKPRVEYAGVKMRSTWEVAFAKRCDCLGLRWEYEPKRFALGSCTYSPDFYLPDSDAYWEVKGWLDTRSQSKVSLMREQYPEVTLVVATKPVLRLFGAM